MGLKYHCLQTKHNNITLEHATNKGNEKNIYITI